LGGPAAREKPTTNTPRRCVAPQKINKKLFCAPNFYHLLFFHRESEKGKEELMKNPTIPRGGARERRCSPRTAASF